MMTTLTYEEWRKAIDEESRRRTGLTCLELFGDEERLRSRYDAGDSNNQAVQELMDKYELSDITLGWT